MAKKVSLITGQELREMFAAATAWLEKSASDIDDLNVFPVPDGDTGTNMLLTMRSSVEEAYRAPDHSAAGVAQALAKGALMGARGNSGVILSQIMRGIAEEIEEKDTISGADLAKAFSRGAKVAYKGLSNPTEGTILTVIKDASNTAIKVTGKNGKDVVAVLEATVESARESVSNTPSLLPVLKEAGVVDAGGQGLYTILEGALHYLKGETEQMQFRKPQVITSSEPLTLRLPEMIAADEVPYGYCTELMLKGENMELEKIRTRLLKKGESLIVVGDDNTIRIHIHTLDPGNIVRYATGLGTIHQVSIRNMDEQKRDFVASQKEKSMTTDVATIAVVAGDGLTEVFSSLGVTTIIPGGQTMNPSTKEIYQAVEEAPSDKVIILPNNKNIILTAEQVKPLTKKLVEIIPTETIPQGVAALLSFDYEADMQTNVQKMKQSLGSVKTIEICRAVRATQINGLKIKKKQIISLLDSELVTAGNNTIDVLLSTLAKINLKKNEILTLYYGADTPHTEAEKAAVTLREKYPHLQVEIIKGDQPHYNFIVSIE
ncbi:MAG: dihydroxyacetone kinase [Chloroflexi bacterium RBG_13_46_9]|nr:MAG: dihydroxyacetone kinase [Chloroflexi bacterium RBG_13_46_9]